MESANYKLTHTFKDGSNSVCEIYAEDWLDALCAADKVTEIHQNDNGQETISVSVDRI